MVDVVVSMVSAPYGRRGVGTVRRKTAEGRTGLSVASGMADIFGAPREVRMGVAAAGEAGLRNGTPSQVASGSGEIGGGGGREGYIGGCARMVIGADFMDGWLFQGLLIALNGACGIFIACKCVCSDSYSKQCACAKSSCAQACACSV